MNGAICFREDFFRPLHGLCNPIAPFHGVYPQHTPFVKTGTRLRKTQKTAGKVPEDWWIPLNLQEIKYQIGYACEGDSSIGLLNHFYDVTMWTVYANEQCFTSLVWMECKRWGTERTPGRAPVLEILENKVAEWVFMKCFKTDVWAAGCRTWSSLGLLRFTIIVSSPMKKPLERLGQLIFCLAFLLSVFWKTVSPVNHFLSGCFDMCYLACSPIGALNQRMNDIEKQLLNHVMVQYY